MTSFPIDITSRMSPSFFHTLAAMYLEILGLVSDNTFSETSNVGGRSIFLT
jgi:hypothetical protein